MPYIEKTRRYELDKQGAARLGEFCATSGELNYTITRLCLSYLNRHGKNYATLSAIRGVLHDVHDELYRRVVVPYEQQKIEENGDVYP